MFRYFALNKPYGVLSQFTEEAGHPGIASLGLNLPSDVWPVGRLDRDSEGLLLLTNDMRYRSELTDPKSKCPKKYWIQVEGAPNEQDLANMERPMKLRIKGKEHHTVGARVSSLPGLSVPERLPPIRERKHIPTQWIQMVITEGKNRQVRRMTAHVGFPTLRLIRAGVGDLMLEDLKIDPGKVCELDWSIANRALR
jgi:23S rRNA pseudouridine2457 synthase